MKYKYIVVTFLHGFQGFHLFEVNDSIYKAYRYFKQPWNNWVVDRKYPVIPKMVANKPNFNLPVTLITFKELNDKGVTIAQGMIKRIII